MWTVTEQADGTWDAEKDHRVLSFGHADVDDALYFVRSSEAGRVLARVIYLDGNEDEVWA